MHGLINNSPELINLLLYYEYSESQVALKTVLRVLRTTRSSSTRSTRVSGGAYFFVVIRSSGTLAS